MNGGLLVRLNVLEKIVAVVAAGGLALTTYRANSIQNELSIQTASINDQKNSIDAIASRQQVIISERKDARDDAQMRYELTQKVFTEFVAALTDQTSRNEARLGRLEGVLALTDAISDLRQREGMISAVKGAIDRLNLPANGPLAERRLAANFDADELLVQATSEQKVEVRPIAIQVDATPTSTHAIWQSYDFDIFWCAGNSASDAWRARAEALLSFRSLDPRASGRWRVRTLPKLTNQRPGFQVTGFEVRYSSPDEKHLAESFKSRFEMRFPGDTMALKLTAQDTPYYLSVFACGKNAG